MKNQNQSKNLRGMKMLRGIKTAGKGDKPRPIEIDKKKFAENWDRIFNKNKKEKKNEKES